MANQQTQGVGSPISNPAYNIIAALHAKLEGLEAYRKYTASDNNPIWQQLTQLDTQAVQLLTQQLEQYVQQGQFRPQQPGQASFQGQGGYQAQPNG